MKYLIEYKTFLENTVNKTKVLCHITGPAGAGKTTIMNDLKEKYPQYNYLDLDTIEIEAVNNLKIKVGIRDFTPSMFKSMHLEKQRLLDKLLKSATAPYVLVGFHDEFPRLSHSKENNKIYKIYFEPNYVLKIDTPNKFLLNTSASLSAKRFKSRAMRKNRFVSDEDLKLVADNSKFVINQLKSWGYKPMTYDSIMKWMEDLK